MSQWRIVRFTKWVPRHPKKSIVFGGLALYGVNYGIENRRVRLMMRAYCREAQDFGEQICPQGDTPRHVTVILNPKTKGSKNLYENYAAPLLYLSGMKVSVFRTEHAGQAKDLMKIMDNTDAVVVAGGDGTLSEAVTGLLSREDRLEASERFPMGFVPTGKTNTLVRRLFYRDGMREQQLAAEAAMAVIRGVKARISAYKVEFHNQKLWASKDDLYEKKLMQLSQKDYEDDGIVSKVDSKSNNFPDQSMKEISNITQAPSEINQKIIEVKQEAAEKQPNFKQVDPVYGVGKIEYGLFRDIDANTERYWYFGPLRTRAAYFFQSLRRKIASEETEIQFSNACSGCKRCVMRELKKGEIKAEEEKEEETFSGGSRWWSSYVKKNLKPKKAPVNPLERYNSVENEKCGQMYDTYICYSNLEIEPVNGALVVRASPANLSTCAVMFDGFKRHSSYVTPCVTDQLHVGEVHFNFPQEELSGSSNIPTPKEDRSPELRLKGAKINIDSNVFARQPLSVTLYPQAINVFVAAR
ncbi:uncharacterized protein LOC111260856 isoform X1 [Varroa jacobsoni]|uniref:uncharacterized protein LOC111260856 isoform X1 n=1 Tax=Varroa jacobsoni TaxID=62625 RepID=UPI000BF7E010|nr:uncharacterized protein LOC111260856 isoform X1 [Varroa jacobsoni]